MDKQIESAQIPSKKQIPMIEVTSSESVHAAEYLQKMGEYVNYSEQVVKKSLKKFQPEKVRFEDRFYNSLQLNLIEESINKEVMIFIASWGNFSMDIKILNIKGSNTRHGSEIDRGVYGNIFAGNFNQNRFIMKCIPIQLKNSRFRTLKQWFILKVASIVGVGPKLQSYFGFDILMYEDCIQFAMEQCLAVTVHNSKTYNFYENMAVLHKFHIVHQDIKPENIMYSPHFDRPVFIDFGLSTIISENIGTKSETYYVGSINYWSPEMGKCFVKKKKMLVDLYYNDLYCLQQTIVDLKNMQRSIDFEDIQFLCESTFQDYTYLTLVLSKYYLYAKQFQQFNNFYQKELVKMDTDLAKYHQSEIIYFCEELPPTRETKDFFHFFVPKKYQETQIYSKFNILYEISQKNYCSVDVFRNQDKHKYFNSIYLEIMIEGNEKYLNQNYKQYMKQFLSNESMIKKAPFYEYLQSYLQYTGYMCDQYQVTSQERLQAAVTYHQVFLEDQIQNIPKEKSNIPKDIIGQTILHALQRCLHQQIKSQQNKNIAYLLFKIYDFLVILDIGTIQQFLKWIQNIYNHNLLSPTQKLLFAMRVDNSNKLNTIRLVTKKGMPRYYVIIKINQWVINKKKLPVNNQKSKLIMKQKIEELSFQFRRNFALQSIQIMPNTFLSGFQRLNDLISKYYSLIGTNQKFKIVYFLAIVYQDGADRQEQNNIIKQIQMIFRKCFRDDDIFNDFSLSFQFTIMIKNQLQNFHKVFSIDFLYKINEYLKRVHTVDLHLFQILITKIWNKIQEKQYKKNNDMTFVYKDNFFIARYFQSIRLKFLKYLQDKRQWHVCRQIIGFQSLLSLSKKFLQKNVDQIRLILRNNDLWAGKLCLKCKNIRKFIIQIDELQHFLLMHAQKQQNPNIQVSEEYIINNFFNRYNLFCKNILEISDFTEEYISIVERGLLYGQLFCSTSRLFQSKFFGIYNYFVFARKYNMLHFYFITPEQQYKLRNMLWELKNKGIDMLAPCLVQFCLLFAVTLNVKWYFQLEYELLKMFLTMQQKQLNLLFTLLKNIQQSLLFRNRKFIVLIYICMFSIAIPDSKLYKQTIAAIYSNINDLAFIFKRKVGVRIYGKIIKDTLKETPKRKILSINNKFVKLLMVDRQTVPRKEHKSKKKIIIFQKLLKTKIRMIQMCNQVKPPLKFRKK